MIEPVTRDQLRKFRRDLAAVDKAWTKELAKVNRTIARDVAALAQVRAESLSPMQAKAAGAIKGYATQTGASVGVRPTAAAPWASAAFWGARRRSGWYARASYAGGKPQFPPWVGNTWEVGVKGQGPYAINDAIAEAMPGILRAWEDGISDLTRRAFPDRAIF